MRVELRHRSQFDDWSGVQGSLIIRSAELQKEQVLDRELVLLLLVFTSQARSTFTRCAGNQSRVHPVAGPSFLILSTTRQTPYFVLRTCG